MGKSKNLNILKGDWLRRTDLTEAKILKIESVLYLEEQHVSEEKRNANNAYLLLQNYALIGNLPEENVEPFIKAKKCMQYSEYHWLKEIEEYRKLPSGTRMYNVYGEERNFWFCRNPEIEILFDREEFYLLNLTEEDKTEKPRYAGKGSYTIEVEKQTKKKKDIYPLTVSVSDPLPEIPEPFEKRIPEKKQPITVSIEDLHKAALDMRSFIKDDYHANAMSKNTIKEVVDGVHVTDAKTVKLENTVNMVGMVSSGKSTFSEVLSFFLANQDKKIVMILDTVTNVLNMCRKMKQYHVSISPFIGRNAIEQRIKEVREKSEDYLALQEAYSEYLCNPCLLMGSANNGDNVAPVFGKEPCKYLMRKNQQFLCPYIHDCNSMRMEREALTSNIIVTTIQGLAQSRLITQNKLFLEYVVENADLVIFDESDKVQTTLDELFVVSTDVDTFRERINISKEYTNRRLSDLSRENKNVVQFYNLCNDITRITYALMDHIIPYREKWEILRSYFSAYSLYHWFKRFNEDENQKFHLPERILKKMESATSKKLIQKESSHFKDIMVAAEGLFDNEPEKEEYFIEKLEIWFEEEKKKALCNGETWEDIDKNEYWRLELFFLITCFDRYMEKLNRYSEFAGSDIEGEELFRFLSARFRNQQEYLPTSVLGNLFTISCNNEKMMMYKHFAFGRALMNKLPWFITTEAGEPAGPHVLLLSGSSWAKGCLQYHVNEPVQYLLEIEEEKKKKISETRFMFLNGGQISGVPNPEKRKKNLKEAVREIKGTIEGELSLVQPCKNKNGEQEDELGCYNKVLMIVNSYEQAEIVKDELNRLFNKGVIAACMTRETESDTHDKVKRHEIARFGKHSANILVAPASVIERGYNIVNDKGHSTFGSVFFLVRPMPVPNEFSATCSKLNGIIEAVMTNRTFNSTYEKSVEIQRIARSAWREIDRNRNCSLSRLGNVWKRDVVASLFIMILQIFGRLCRLTDLNLSAPRVYFVDSAFHATSKDGFDLLNEMNDYLYEMMNGKTKEIAHTLYGGFYNAFKKGIPKNEQRTDDEDEDDDVASEE